MSKLLKFLFVVMGALAIGYLAFGTNRAIEGRTESNVLSKTQVQASLLVGDSSYQVSLSKGSSVYDLMQAVASLHSDFTFQGKDFGPGMGFFVDEINGVKGGLKQGKYWIYYINNKEAQVGVSNYMIKPNDVITWKYEENNN